MVKQTLEERIRGDMNAARRQGDRMRARLFSTILSDLRNREIELRHALDEAEAVQVVTRAIRMRNEAAEQMASRPELAERERKEAEILEGYLPPRLGEEEIRSRVAAAIEAGATDLGGVMGRIMPELRGRADGREVNRIAREELEARRSAT